MTTTAAPKCLLRFFSAVLDALFLLTLSCANSSLTPDQNLENLFYKNERQFTDAVSMMHDHSELTSVCHDTILARGSSATNLSENRVSDRKVLSDIDWAKFTSAFRILQIRDCIKAGPNGSVFFPVDKVSIWNGDREKGILFTNRPPAPVVQALDKFRSRTEGIAYKYLKPGWYLYLSSG